MGLSNIYILVISFTVLVFTGCRGALPLPPPWLFLIENQHTELQQRGDLPFAIAKQYQNPLPEAPQPIEVPTIAWVDFTGESNRHPLAAKNRGYRPSTR